MYMTLVGDIIIITRIIQDPMFSWACYQLTQILGG